MTRFSLLAATAITAFFAAQQTCNASTTVVDSLSAFQAATTGNTTVDFNGILCAGCTSYYYNPSISHDGITFSGASWGPSYNTLPVGVVSRTVFGWSSDYLSNATVANQTHQLTITLSSPVTAFGMDVAIVNTDQRMTCGSGSSCPSPATFSLSNNFSTVFNSPFGSPGNPYGRSVQFVGFLSDTPFDTIRLDPGSVSQGWMVFDVTSATATPLPAALPLFASGAGLIGFLGWRKKRKAQASAAVA